MQHFRKNFFCKARWVSLCWLFEGVRVDVSQEAEVPLFGLFTSGALKVSLFENTFVVTPLKVSVNLREKFPQRGLQHKEIHAQKR